MNFEEIKSDIMNMDANDQKRLIMELVPQIWKRACEDESCAFKLKDLVDSDVIRTYAPGFGGGL